MSRLSNARTELENYEKTRPADYVSQYQPKIKDVMGQLDGMKEFDYDPDADTAYQQYKSQYTRSAKLANQNAQANAAAQTGGYGSSYGTQAGQNAYTATMNNLDNVLNSLQDQLGRGRGKRHLLGLVRRGKLGLQLGNLRIACGQIALSSVTHRRLGKLGFVILTSQLCAQAVDFALELGVLLLSIGAGLYRRALACALALCSSALELGAQLGKFGIALGDLLRQLLSCGILLLDKLGVTLGLRLLQSGRRTRALKLQRPLALALDRLHTLIQVVRELGIAHLLDDIRIAGRIDLKNFAAMRALNLVHGSSSMDANINRIHSTAPHGQKRRRRHNGNGAKTTTKVSVPFVVVRELQPKKV